MYTGHKSQLSTKRILDGNNQFDEIMKNWIKKYNDLLSAGEVEEIELTGKLSTDGLKCQKIVEKFNAAQKDEVDLEAEMLDDRENPNHLKMNGGF